jgi:hypothetical protein
MGADAPYMEYITPLIKFTAEMFHSKKGVPPIFIMEKDGDIQPIKVPPSLIDSEEGKEELSLMIANAVATFQPDSHCFVAEAWMYKMEDFDNKEEAMKAYSDFKKGIPCDKIIKVEAVTFTLTKINFDKSQERWMGSMPFSRGSDNSISSFDPVKWIKEGGSNKFEAKLFI